MANFVWDKERQWFGGQEHVLNIGEGIPICLAFPVQPSKIRHVGSPVFVWWNVLGRFLVAEHGDF